MSFAPVVPSGGITGWIFLKRTMPAQQAAQNALPSSRRDEAYFREKIGKVTSAEDLIADRRLLSVSLGTFGLEADINNKYFIRKVLEGGTLDAASLANKLADKQYLKLAAAFGFDLGTPNTQISGFADSILSQYATRRFETAVGAQRDDMRLALNAERELKTLAGSTSSDRTKWYGVLGSAPLRKVFETALGLPAAFASINLDQQVTVMKAKTDALFGEESLAQFADPAKTELLIRRFLMRSDAAGPATSPALQLLQASGRGSGLLSLLR